MSDISAAIRDHLLADTSVAAIVATRVRLGWARSSDFRDRNGAIRAYIVIQKTGGDQPHHMTAAVGLAMPVVEVNCFAGSRGIANLLSEAVREALDGKPNAAMGDDDLDVRRIALIGPAIELDEPPTDSSQRGVYRDLLTFDVGHVQSVPT